MEHGGVSSTCKPLPLMCSALRGTKPAQQQLQESLCERGREKKKELPPGASKPTISGHASTRRP